MTDIVVYVSLGVVAIGLLMAIATGKFKNTGIGPASITAFHDFQPKDKQEAIEIVMEQKAGKKMQGEKSGEGNDANGKNACEEEKGSNGNYR
jgi:hypothetical protein